MEDNELTYIQLNKELKAHRGNLCMIHTHMQ